jgi:hypothetical protein
LKGANSLFAFSWGNHIIFRLVGVRPPKKDLPPNFFYLVNLLAISTLAFFDESQREARSVRSIASSNNESAKEPTHLLVEAACL